MMQTISASQQIKACLGIAFGNQIRLLQSTLGWRVLTAVQISTDVKQPILKEVRLDGHSTQINLKQSTLNSHQLL